MDHKISMPEVLHMIFSELRSLAPRKEASANLAAVARTCKTFRGPALDILWSVQDSLIPALRCLPADLWDRSAQSKNDTFIKFRRPLVSTDLERPRLYWNRIRQLRLFDTPISPDVCQMLSQHCPGGTVFPNLQQLSWPEQRNIVSSLVLPFLSPRMRSIDLVPGSITDTTLIPLLGAKCPELRDVDFRGSTRHHFKPDVLHGIFLFLSQIQHLETFCISNVDSPILEHIARLPSLKDLVIDEVPGMELLRDESQPHFPALEVLSLWAATPQTAIAFLGAMVPHHQLTSFVISFDSTFPNSDTVAQLYATVATHCSHEALECLHIEDEVFETPSVNLLNEFQFESYLVDPAALRPLFAFGNLTTVLLRPYFGFAELDDDTVTELAQAWPLVEELTLTFAMDQHLAWIRTRVTLKGVVAIARHCPKLRELALFFSALDVPQPDGCRQMSLVKLDVACSPITSSGPTTIFLSRLFPKLETVRTYCYATENTPSAVRRWKNVDNLLRGPSNYIYRGIQSEESDTEDEDL